jgi:8-amino-7-oxononanoate synthase
MKIDEFGRVIDASLRVGWAKSNNAYTYLLPNESKVDRTVIVHGKEMIMLGSYNYLGLIGHPKINKAMKDAIDQFGSGAGGVRLLTGNNILNEKLEKKIAEFKGAEEAVVYSSGFIANLAVISALFDKEDRLIIDRFAHNSIYRGCNLSGASLERFKHNDMEDLKRVLEESKNFRKKMIIVDGVYSMEGDISPVPDIVELAKKYDANVMVDEAHSLGVLGETGHGINEHFGLKEGDVDIYMGTLSKAIPSVGGYVAGSKKMVNFLKHYSDPFIFSAALPPSDVAASIAALEIIDQEKERVEKLRQNIKLYRGGIKSLGFKTVDAPTPIVPVIIGDDMSSFRFAKRMQNEGVYVLPVVYPAVPKDSGRLRTCLMASHTTDDIKKVLDTLEKVGKDMNVI